MDFQSMLSKLKKDASQAPPPPARKKQKISDGNHDGTNTHQAANETIHHPFPKRKVCTIYLACPANVQTGGPEAIHQLCHKINSLGGTIGESKNGKDSAVVTAYMLFVKETQMNRHHQPQAEHVPDADILHTYKATYPNLKIATSFPMKYNNDYEGDSCDSEKMVKKYGADVDSINYYNDSLIIWPECWTYLIDSLQPMTTAIPRYQTAIWWLSVDNNNDKFRDWGRKDILHLYQSEYARNNLIKNIQKSKSSPSSKELEQSSGKGGCNNGIENREESSCNYYHSHNILPMTEFIPNNRLKDKVCYDNRKLQILYNPFKGVHYTDSIMRRSDTKFQFTPIGSIHKRISPQDVTKLLHEAKVYIDFGPHPGMDRLPREAALAGCIVITNMQGAAFYEKDVPIPSEYKVKEFNVDSIHRLLVSCIDGYDKRVKDFDPYRDWIHNQEDKMDYCVKDMLTKLAVQR